MKPNLDLDDPRVKLAVSAYRKQMEKALAVSQHIEDAVLPIYWTLMAGKKPEQIGSGVVVRIESEHFIFSASHVFDDIGSYALLIGAGDGSKLATLSGDRFSSKKGPSGTHADDPVDASVFHIKSGITDKIRAVAISLEDFDFSQPDKSEAIYMAAGFRVKKSNTKGEIAKAKRECFPSIEYGRDEYISLNINGNTQIAIAFDNQVLINGKWQTSPTPKGMSGGAIIKVQGVNMAPPFLASPNARQLLAAIIIEQRRGKAGKPGVLLGTRIRVHLALINNYLPNLLNFKNIPIKSI